MTLTHGRPPVVDLGTWQAARDELLVREKAHTLEGDAIAAARRRLPMVQVDGTVEVASANGPVPFVDLFQGRDELVELTDIVDSRVSRSVRRPYDHDGWPVAPDAGV